MPKPNMYQSLHNTLITRMGRCLRCRFVHGKCTAQANTVSQPTGNIKRGRANEKSSKAQKSEEAKLAWLRQIMEWQKDMSDNKEYLDTIKLDLNIYSTQVYAFYTAGGCYPADEGFYPD